MENIYAARGGRTNAGLLREEPMICAAPAFRRGEGEPMPGPRLPAQFLFAESIGAEPGDAPELGRPFRAYGEPSTGLGLSASSASGLISLALAASTPKAELFSTGPREPPREASAPRAPFGVGNRFGGDELPDAEPAEGEACRCDAGERFCGEAEDSEPAEAEPAEACRGAGNGSERSVGRGDLCRADGSGECSKADRDAPEGLELRRFCSTRGVIKRIEPGLPAGRQDVPLPAGLAGRGLVALEARLAEMLPGSAKRLLCTGIGLAVRDCTLPCTLESGLCRGNRVVPADAAPTWAEDVEGTSIWNRNSMPFRLSSSTLAMQRPFGMPASSKALFTRSARFFAKDCFHFSCAAPNERSSADLPLKRTNSIAKGYRL
mmetsp:Transcript_123790/g.396209  ORF Transcript_123790/g.396209 Transcript_123790/m.396209 type:complete len:377 (-) Transcript_123790:3301-4431(-)